jgi:tetratricopeptide (TPR) repeat protein
MLPGQILQNVQLSLEVTPDHSEIVSWIQAVTEFCKNSTNPREEFIAAETRLNEIDSSFVKGAGTIASASFEYGLERNVLKSMLALADCTGIAALRFTAAWIAFNMNEFDFCIRECEKIEDHGYHVFGLMGQAQLESGDPKSAIDSINIALKMNPNDAALWFQLTKAFYVFDEHSAAWTALESCVECGGLGPESALMKCAIASAIFKRDRATAIPLIENASRSLRTLFPDDPNKTLIMLYASKNALLLDSEKSFLEEMGHYLDKETVHELEKFNHEIAIILRELQHKQWGSGIELFLDLLTTTSQKYNSN